MPDVWEDLRRAREKHNAVLDTLRGGEDVAKRRASMTVLEGGGDPEAGLTGSQKLHAYVLALEARASRTRTRGSHLAVAQEGDDVA